jgi:hypothetical protein
MIRSYGSRPFVVMTRGVSGYTEGSNKSLCRYSQLGIAFGVDSDWQPWECYEPFK